jgi:hypothetical protein
VERDYGNRHSDLQVSVDEQSGESDVLFPGTFNNSSSIRSDRLSPIVRDIRDVRETSEW